MHEHATIEKPLATHRLRGETDAVTNQDFCVLSAIALAFLPFPTEGPCVCCLSSSPEPAKTIMNIVRLA